VRPFRLVDGRSGPACSCSRAQFTPSLAVQPYRAPRSLPCGKSRTRVDPGLNEQLAFREAQVAWPSTDWRRER